MGGAKQETRVRICRSFTYVHFRLALISIVADQYNDFGRDVQLLHQNLLQLKNVFKKVEESTQKFVPMNSEFYDTSALNTILDDPFLTIAECKELLRGKISYSGQTSPIQNLIWNFAIEAEVTTLHNRIKAHNVKIVALLKPLEMYVKFLVLV
jgi:hypothetical protein